MPKETKLVQLKAETEQAFVAYIGGAENAMQQALRQSASSWSDADPDRARQVRQGEVVAQCWSGRKPVRVKDGLIHDWGAAALIPGTTVKLTLKLVQDYDNHKNIYKPEVIDSKLLSRDGDDFKVHLRLLKKKVVTVVLDTYHDVHYAALGSNGWHCRSHTTRIQEVEGAGTPNEEVLPPDSGHGFLWRLYSYWRFQEKEEGVFVECRAISLSRAIPLGLGWLIEPIVQTLPRESLINTLEATRRALRSEESHH
jgi:hypothetical protein